MKKYWLFKGIKFAVLGLAFVALASSAVMLLWNALLPALFGWKVIGFWQALGLLALSKLLFGGRMGHKGGRGRCGGGHRGNWKSQFEAKWDSLTEEEKAKMKEKWGRSGHCHSRGTEEKAASSSAE